MQLFTARYSNKAVGSSGLVPVRITLGRPRFRLPYTYDEARLLAPTPTIFKMASSEAFEPAYREHLDRLTVDRIRQALQAIGDRYHNDRLVLLCFEDLRKPGAACHRRMFAARSPS